jgi:uncharacterized membrane protein YfcA
MHMALGTSMATILFTSISSVRAHHRHGAVLWPIVLRITPGILLGTLLGTELASRVPSTWLGLIFTAFICYVAVHMLIGGKTQPERELPGALGTALVGVGIDETTAIFVTGTGFEVLGRNSVVVIDARKAAVAATPAGRLAAGRNLALSVLTAGMTYSLD